jgi:predicted anti-sigma-YlaC factor YlaD
MAGDCRGARLACSLQLDGELTLRRRERLVRHLRFCGRCRSFARELEAIGNLLRGSPGSTRSRTRAAGPSSAPQCRQVG